jgi:pimeloyl-ACP methyl ester carboxylesterase
MPVEVMAAESKPLETVAGQSVALELNGFELRGERWSGGGRAHVLLVHGLGGNSVTWHGVAPLVARSLRAEVLAIDLPGFGRSRTRGRRVDVRTLSGLLESIMRTEAPHGTRWVVAGNSLGGVLALELACRVPDLVLGVSVLAPALPLSWGRGPRGVAALSSWLPAAAPFLGGWLIGRYMTRVGLPGVVDEPIRALFGDAARLDAGLRDLLLGVSGDRLGWAMEAGSAYEQVTRSLGIELLRPSGVARWIRDTRCPVLAIAGGRDPIFPATAWRVLEGVRPDWTFVTLPDIGHVPQLEAPTEVAWEMTEWHVRSGFLPPD